MLPSKHTVLNLAAAMVGILVLGIPMLLFNSWLKKQGEDESSITAAWIIDSAERQIGQTTALLTELSARGVDSCQPAQIDQMRQLVLLSGLIKEVTLISPSGQTLCSDAGRPLGYRDVVASIAVANSDIILDVLRVTDLGDRFLRVRKIGQPGRPSIAALMSTSTLLPHATLPSGRSLAFTRMALINGAVLGSSGVASEGDYEHASAFLRRASSTRYGLNVVVAMVGNDVIADYEDLHRIGMVVTGLIALIILLIALVFGRQRVNPVAVMAQAIEAGEFIPFYQPVVDIQTGRLLGAEVLMRWRRENGSLVPPSAFIPLMESSGLIMDATRSLMRRVCEEMGAVLGPRPSLSVAFNVAPHHFDDALILNDVGAIFDGTPIKLSQIILEVTERYEVENLTATRRVIAALQGLGCKVAIDDVGAGHSGLSYILKLGPDIIKIDKIFVDAIDTDGGRSKVIIETLVDLARNMKMEIIAEGVENFDQVTYLREHGISAVQGYVFAPPLPCQAFLQLIEAMGALPESAGELPATKPAKPALVKKAAAA